MCIRDRFLENVSTSCIWLRNGKTKKLNKNFTHFDEWAQIMEEQDQKQLEKLDLRLKEENHWLSRGVTAVSYTHLDVYKRQAVK